MTQIHRRILRSVDGAPGQIQHEQQAQGGNYSPRDLDRAARMDVLWVFLFGGARAAEQQRAQQHKLSDHAAGCCGPKQNGSEFHAERCTPGALDSTVGVRLQWNQTNALVIVRMPLQLSGSGRNEMIPFESDPNDSRRAASCCTITACQLLQPHTKGFHADSACRVP